MGKDVTGREQRQDEQAALLQALIHTSPVAVIAIDPEGRITTWSPAAERIFGWTEREVLGRPDPTVPEDQWEEYRALREMVLRGMTFTGVEVCRRRKDGSGIELSISAAPLRDARGAVIGIMAVLVDVTNHKRAQEALNTAFEREQHTADTLQRSLLLPNPGEVSPALDVAMLYEAALDEAGVGGDFADAFALDGGKVALVVGDVCGKGLEAAVYTAKLKYALRAYLREVGHPARALSRLNRFVCDAQRLDGWGDDSFTALSLATVGTASGEVMFAAAGAEPPLVLRSHGGVEEVAAGGLLLGVSPQVSYQTRTLRLAPGDAVLMVTDGVTEARCDGRFLGYDGMMEIARRALTPDPLRQVGHAILGKVHAYAGGALHDDACLLLARRLYTT